MSTPINQLRQEEDNSQVVENILNQFEQDGQQAPQMPQPPPQQMEPQHMQQPPQQHGGQMIPDEYEGFDDEYYDQVQERELSQTEEIVEQLKLPLLVVFLVFLTNFDMVNELLIKNVPRLVTDGNLNMMGIAAKAVLAGLVYYLVKKFVL
jgi:hypothetical protein